MWGSLRLSMRVTGGRLAGRRLRVPRGGVRPSSDRVRESLFARVGSLEGARVLDLFAGCGALGIEALSRGATHAVFVDRASPSVSALRRNLEELQLRDSSRVVRGDVRAVLRRLAREAERFDLVLLDPPYASRDTPAVLSCAVEAGILASGATLVVESSCHGEPAIVPGLVLVDRKRYGDTTLTRMARAEAGEEARGSMARERTEKGGGSVGLFAASFDPVTNGHLDLVARARRVFDELVVAVGDNLAKTGTFGVEERVEMLESVLGREPGIRVSSFQGLVVDYAREVGAKVVVRGLRAMSDFEYEFEMALMNKHLHPELETMFMMADQQYLYVSSTRLKELVRFGASVDDFVPPLVAKMLREKVGRS
ncbi:MAG: pantetheine-phosphate adenylyltransferase [Myxococcota bacterium]